MSRKMTIFILSILIVAVVFFTPSCKKLNVNQLRANHHFTKANNHFTESQYRLAIEEYERALEFNPELTLAYRFLGESYKNQYRAGDESPENLGRAEKAIENLNLALEKEPTNIQIVHSLGDMYDRMQRFEDAEGMFLRVLELDPTNMENYYVVAGFYNRYAGDHEEIRKKAEEMYLRRIELDPDNHQGYAYAAQFYDNVRPIPDFDRAYAMHNMILGMKPDDALMMFTIGVNRFNKAYRLQNLLSRQERIALADESEATLMKSAEMDPNYPDTFAYINLLYRNVHAVLFPERSERFIREADRYMERYSQVRKRQLERLKLEEELKKGQEER
ncbi:MAG: tetratricopeptide repeat protein [Candidatus Aminicenantes bacterium]|nr:MAG: tetratricopeptide repeat protein [Candidatus Aminicenantes bacterium]